MVAPSKPIFFGSAAEFGRWLRENHTKKQEVVVGFRKVGTGRPTLSWSDAVDEALCYGWIDGIRKGIDDESYQIRFTPRKPGSKWSALNLRKAQALIEGGRMRPAGLVAWKARTALAGYSYETPEVATLSPAEEKALKANRPAWKDWMARPPGYRKIVTKWIVSAKKEETRKRRLVALMESSAAGELIPPMRYGRRRSR